MTDLIRYTGDRLARATLWTDLDAAERRRRAVAACRDRSETELWSLLEAHLTLYGKAGARVSPNTVDTYRVALRVLLDTWSGVNLLHPDRDTAATLVRQWEADGASPSTISVRLAAARALYRALRWARAIDTDPLADVRPARDPTPAHEKRQPYPDAAIEALLAVATTSDRLLLLLGAHAGLRVSEILALRWEDIDLDRRVLTVLHGKGGKRRTVHLSRTLAGELLLCEPRIGRVVPYRTDQQARNRIRTLCEHTGTTYRGLHALRHSCGTRLYRETGRLEDAQHQLGHSDISTTAVYAKYADDALRTSVGEW